MVDGFLFLVLLVSATDSAHQVKYTSNRYQKGTKCPLGPVVTAEICGELGNTLWDFASILALARLLPGDYQPYMRFYHAKFIERYFVKPLLPLVEDIPRNCSCWDKSDLMKSNEGAGLAYVSVSKVQQWKKPGNMILHSPSLAVAPVMHELQFIKTRLRIKPELIENANLVFDDVAAKMLKKFKVDRSRLCFVGVHVRRADYLDALRAERRAGPEFFNFAFDFFRQRQDLGKCAFLVITDDHEWVQTNLIANETNSDVFLVGNGLRRNPGLDITVYSHCNHTIFDYGSFGLWGAVWVGGQVVTTNSYERAYPLITYKNFHFFEPKPKRELLELSFFKKLP